MASEEEGEQEAQELEPSYWAVSSYGIRGTGPTATAITNFREAKPGEVELEDPRSNPSSRPSTKGGSRSGRPGTGGSDPTNTLGQSGWARSISTELAEAGKPKKEEKEGLQQHDVPFPWLHPTAISDDVYEDGLHEFHVEVHCVGQIGFVDAKFKNEREKIAQHWLNRDNIGRCWVLHSNGYFCTGNKCTPVSRRARFAPLDRLRLVLDLYKEKATFYLDTGVQREMGSIEGIDRAVRLGFQMYHKKDSIVVLSVKDRSSEVAAREKGGAHMRRAQRQAASAAAAKDVEEAEARWSAAEAQFKLAEERWREAGAEEEAREAGAGWEAVQAARRAADAPPLPPPRSSGPAP